MLGFDLGSVASLRRFQTQFEDLGKIGSGGFSHVHKVRSKRDNKIYALKTVKIKPSQFKGQVADYLEKVLGQARVLSGLKHPNVLQYHGCWVNADLKFGPDSDEQEEANDQQELQLIMEEYQNSSCGFQFQKASSSSLEKKMKVSRKNKKNYIEQANDNIFGTDLLKYKQIRVYLLSQLGQHSLQKHVYLRNQEYRKTFIEKRKMVIQNYKIILDIIQGLSYIHSQKVIHRDIKLQNIIINDKKECKIIDFGLAKKVRNFKSLTIEKFSTQFLYNQDDCDQKHSSSVGTKIFSSPEQTNSQNYDHRTDIYSLGMVIGILFSQYKTAHEEGQLLLNLRNKKLQNFQIDERLKNIVFRCLSQQKFRPELKQLKNCVKSLLKEEIQNTIQPTNNSEQNSSKSSYKKIKKPFAERNQKNVVLQS